MKKKIYPFLALLGLSVLFSCQNELVKRIEDQLQVDTPVIAEEADGLDKIISISTSTDGADIYYTTNNTEPRPSNSEALLYSGPIELSGHGESVYIRTRAFKKDMTPSSETVAQFGNIYPSPPPPVFTQAGGLFSTVQSIGILYPDLTGTLWESDGVTIHYTTDGSTPTASSPIYRPGITSEISVNPGTESDTATVIINAISIHPDYPASRAASGVFTVTYLEKAPAPAILAVDQSNSASLSSGIVFGPAEVTITPQAGSVLHYRTRQDAEAWSEWSTSSAASVLTILDNSPRDGEVVTVQAYVSRAGYRNSDMSISSFSYLILTVPPPCLTMVCPFSSGSTYGRDFMIDFESFDDMTVYYTVDGTVPVPGTEGISGSSTHLFNGTPVTGDDNWLYSGEMVTGQPMFINAVHESGGRVSPVSTYWCNVDVTPPAAPSSFVCDGGHERITFTYTGMPSDVNDMIITYDNGVYGDDTSLTGLPANSAHIEPLPSNNSEYAISAVIRDQYRNERVLLDEDVWVCSVTNTADSGPGSLRQAVLDAGSGDTITFDPGVFDNADGDDVIRLNTSIEISQNQTINGDADGDGYGDVVISGGSGFSGPALKVSETAQLTLAFRDLSFENLRSTDSNTSALFLAINSETTVTIESCAFINNECASTAGDQGGAVYIETLANTIYTPVEITDCVFVGNSTEERGGAVCSLFQPLLITGSLFAKNSADSSIGGGAVAVYPPDITAFKPLTINNSTFFENASGNPGSKSVVIYNIAGSSPERNGRSVIINESIFWDYNDGNSNGQVLNSLNYPGDLTINIDHSIVNGGVDMDPMFETPEAADYSTDGIWFNGNDALRVADASPCNINSSGDDVGCYANAASNPFLSGTTRVYVKETNSNTPLTGANWDSALTDPQQAIDMAYWYGLSEVWVASGIYHPQSQPNGGSGGQRDNHFAMREGVSVVGGFIAGQSTRATSDLDGSGAIDPWEFTNPTVFSGDFDNNDGSPSYNDGYYESMGGNTSENACHVIFNNEAFSVSKIPVVDGITIEGGNANKDNADKAGGGICQIGGANAVFRNCTISENQTDFGASPAGGGGIYQEGGTLTLTGCLLTRNKADNGGSDPDGGAIMLNSAGYAITGCRFYHNYSTGTAACIYFNNCDTGVGVNEMNRFEMNKAQSSTVIKYFRTDFQTISKCLFDRNYAVSNVTGITYQESSDNTAQYCLFTNNLGYGANGGVLYTVNTVPASTGNIIQKCTLYGNRSSGSTAGGCGNLENGGLTVKESILADNSFFNYIFILMENSLSDYDYRAVHPTVAFVEDVDAFYFVDRNDILGGDGNWFDENDGFNIGSWSYANFNEADADWGAYETDLINQSKLPVLYVRTGGSGGDNTGRDWENPIWIDNNIYYLNTVIMMAYAYKDIKEVRIGPGIYYPGDGTDREACFPLFSGVKVTGGYIGNDLQSDDNSLTILSGDIDKNGAIDAGNSYHVFYFPSWTAPVLDKTAILENITITGGNANGSGEHYLGGGVYIGSGQDPAIVNCRIDSNQAQSAGGIYINGGTYLYNCIISNNKTINNGGGLLVNTTLFNIINCRFSKNESMFAGGGGLAKQGAGNLTLTNCLFDNNKSYNQGAGILNEDGYTYVRNGSFYENYGNATISDSYSIEGTIYSYNTITSNNSVYYNNPSDGDFTPVGLAINTGNLDSVPSDTFDLDKDGIFDEPIPYDLLGNTRQVLTVDLGAIEAR